MAQHRSSMPPIVQNRAPVAGNLSSMGRGSFDKSNYASQELN